MTKTQGRQQSQSMLNSLMSLLAFKKVDFRVDSEQVITTQFAVIYTEPESAQYKVRRVNPMKSLNCKTPTQVWEAIQ